MTLFDRLPGRAWHTLCLHGFDPVDSGGWKAAYGLLLACHRRAGAEPATVTLDDVPRLKSGAWPLKAWETWLQKHPFPQPSALYMSADVVRGLAVPGLKERAAGWVSAGLGSPAYYADGRPTTIDGGEFLFYSDVALSRHDAGAWVESAREAWAVCRFQYGYVSGDTTN